MFVKSFMKLVTKDRINVITLSDNNNSIFGYQFHETFYKYQIEILVPRSQLNDIFKDI